MTDLIFGKKDGKDAHFEYRSKQPRTLLRQLAELVGHGTPDATLEEKKENRRGTSSPRHLSSTIEFDAVDDCRYARNDPSFSRVAHIFHQNWHGIRSAAGVQPGHKVAIPLQCPLRKRDFIQLVSWLEKWGIQKAVFHGFSDVADCALKAVSGTGIDCYLVWHGSLSQLVLKPEVLFFERALRACQRGNFRRAHMLKADMGMVFPRAYEPMLLNCAPVTDRRRLVPAFAGQRRIALVAAYPNMHKNVHSNLVGAALSNSIHEIFHYSEIRGTIPIISRCKQIPYNGHHQHISFLHEIDVNMNITTIDCHPMVDMEALGAGAMVLSGPLFLDALTKHPFTTLSVIANPFNVREIAKRLDYLSAMNNAELQEIISNYSSEVTSISRERYAEFLHL